MAAFVAVSDCYDCNLYQPQNGAMPRYVPSHEAVFSIAFFSPRPERIYRNLLMLQKHILRGNTTSWSRISSTLSEVNVPYHAHPALVHKITQGARAAASECQNMDGGVIPLVVTIDIINPRPAASTCQTDDNNNLEQIKVEGRPKQCVICLEQMVLGSNAARLPCFHVYHQTCIVDWLNISNHCPLCRSGFDVFHSLCPIN